MAEEFDVIIAGAGAAGLMCAGVAIKRGLRVALLDHADAPGEKIRISGGGRCNFTNIHTAPDRFISKNPHFCKSALARYTAHDFIDMVKRHRIRFHEKTLGQLFCDGRSQEIIDMLLAECAGVDLRLETTVEDIERTNAGFKLRAGGALLKARALVIATGGPSIPKMGATGFAYDLARRFDLAVVEPWAGLVPLTFTDDIQELTKSLSGLAVDPAIVSVGKKSFREALLFTHRGLSGPAILQISSYWRPGEEVVLNLLPDRDAFTFLKDARAAHPKKMLRNALADLLPERLANAIAARTHEAKMADLSDAKLKDVAAHINDWRVKPNGTEGYRTAEVTLGGVDTDELSAKTFETKKIPGLYFIGEAVDVTGWLGGYNFQWAWSSGYCCGESL